MGAEPRRREEEERVSPQKQRDKGRDFIRVVVTLVLSLGVKYGNLKL